MDFTFEKQELMAIYNPGTRLGPDSGPPGNAHLSGCGRTGAVKPYRQRHL